MRSNLTILELNFQNWIVHHSATDTFHVEATNMSWRLPPGLPEFSRRIQDALDNGDVGSVYSRMIEETALWIIENGDIKDPYLYKEFGRKFCIAYPCIAATGYKEPHAVFTKKLSQKLRKIRYNLKRCYVPCRIYKYSTR